MWGDWDILWGGLLIFRSGVASDLRQRDGSSRIWSRRCAINTKPSSAIKYEHTGEFVASPGQT